MQIEKVEYKGYTIRPLPSHESDDQWYSGYHILKDNVTVTVREHIFPAFFYEGAARTESIELAKMEIDYRAGASIAARAH